MKNRILWVAAGCLLSAAAASSQTISEFRPSRFGARGFGGIVAGPDGNLWFTETSSRIGKITPSGFITEFPVTPGSGPEAITAGPDGNLWFTEALGDRIGRITTAGVVTEFPLPPGSRGPADIAAGPDGNLWFTVSNHNRIGRITTDGVITEFELPSPASNPLGITAGPDGAMWFVELTEDRVGRITMAGEITEFPIPAGSEPLHIAAGPDGALWLTAPGRNRIGRMATDGSYTEFPIPSSDAVPSGITAGPDGAMWFTEAFRNQIGRITTDGVVTAELPIPSPASEPRGITVGGDDNVWFTGFNTGTIGRVNLANACGDPDTNLCLNDGRFQVSASWRKTNGETGIAHAIALTEDSGYFWFFDSTNIELVVKALNACGINDHFWVFAAGLTNVEVELSILDTVSGTVAEYLNPQSTAFRPIQDTSAFSTCPAHLQSGDREASEAAVLESDPSALPSYSWTEVRPLDAIGPCVASATAMCLNGRFQVESTWLKASGDTGPGHPIQLTADSGYFWFFNPENVELITKVLGGCGINQHQWVFAGGLTNVQVELTVTDTQTGAVQHYINPQGTAFQPIQDTSAFSTCP